VVNLLTNATQALTARREDNEIRVSTYTDESGAAVIEVEDNGLGMSDEVRLSAFEPFFTTKAPGHGTGLGLSICRTIISGFGGEISVESRLGEGTRFRVVLPACSEDLPARDLESVRPPISPPPSGRPSRAAPKLLVIDDEPMIRALVQRLLEGRYQVTSADGVREALAVLNQGRRFDAILCDLMMPGESGMDFFAVLRRLYPDLIDRVAFITGGAVTPDTSKFLDTSARPVLNKPFNPEALVTFLEQLIGASATPAAYRL
jgi:CheY-like chemotaxis protein